MKLISWNVNGIRAISKKGFIEWLQKESPDVLCVQETKAHPDQLTDELLAPNGYKTYWSVAEKKGYSGTAVFTKTEPKSATEGIGTREYDNEGRTLVLDYGDFVLFNIYFPNGGASDLRLKYKLGFYKFFHKHVLGLLEDGKQVIICGDVNTAHKEIDIARPRENEGISGFLPVERAWIDKLLSSGFIDSFRLFHSDGGNYTWWDYKTGARKRNVGWRLDYFFISDNLLNSLEDAFILKDVFGSDHCPVGIMLTQ